MAIHVLLNGARGRMGRAIAALAAECDVALSAEIDLGDDPRPALAQSDVIIDFSFHAATAGLLRLAAEAGKAMVIGTTGHTEEEKREITALTSRVPTVWAGNFSIGVNVLFYLTQKAVALLTDDFDIEVLEMHHRFKKDAPSGTAERLLEILSQQRNLASEDLRHGRRGITGERTRREIGVHALRGGDVVGDHTVYFAAPGERLELTHRASDRSIFARGALHAARWVAARPPGLYDMQDVLGLKDPATGP